MVPKAHDLLSLPDHLLARVLLKTRSWDAEPLKNWARAASTCKRLWELQLPCDPVVREWQSEPFTILTGYF